MTLDKSLTSQYKETYTSFSGADIIATFTAPGKKPTVIGELQAITYSVTREKAPIYTMGSPDPRSFSRGKRGIAGSLVFTVFDRDALINALGDANYTAVNGEVGISPVDKWGDNIALDDEGEVTEITDEQKVIYADQIPPFDVTINFVNEYGKAAVMRIKGVEILNEGSGMSIDDITTDKACTFVARGIDYMQSVNR